MTDRYVCDLVPVQCHPDPDTGQTPPARTCHTAVIVRDRSPASNGKKMIVFGGFYDMRYHNDLWELDLSTYQWRKIVPRSSSSSPPSSSAASTGATSADQLRGLGKKKRRAKSARPLGLACVLDQEIDISPSSSHQDEDDEDHFLIFDTMEESCRSDSASSNINVFAAAEQSRLGTSVSDAMTTQDSDLPSPYNVEILPVRWPPPRAAHTAVVRPTSEGDRMIIFGGQRSKDMHHGDLWEYDHERNEWHEIESKNEFPEARSFHAMIYRSNTDSIIIFSGQDSDEGVMPDMWEFSFETQRWNILLHEEKKEVQQCEHAFPLGSRMAILESYDQVKVCVFDFSSLEWIVLNPRSRSSISYRHQFLGELLGNRALILFGGRDDEDCLFDDLFVFDIATQTWHDIKLKDESMRDQLTRSFCSCVPLDSHNILIFGGKYNDERVNSCYRLSFSESLLSERIVPSASFQKSLGALRQSQLLSDITLVSNDGRRFNVHRLILALFIPYFKMLFTGGYQDSEEREMVMEEIDGETLDLVLNFVYGQETEINSNRLQRFIKIALAANMLMIQPLVKICMERLVVMVDDDNIEEIFKFACEMGDAGKILAQKCMQKVPKCLLQQLVHGLVANAATTAMPPDRACVASAAVSQATTSLSSSGPLRMSAAGPSSSTAPIDSHASSIKRPAAPHRCGNKNGDEKKEQNPCDKMEAEGEPSAKRRRG